MEWTRAVFPLTAGQHTLSFTYTKDYSVNRGSDCAWIDMLMLPHNSRPVSCSSTDLCQGQSVTSHGDTVPTDQPASFSLVFENNNTVVIEDYTVHPATYTIDTVEACDSYVWNGTEYTASCNTVSSFSDVNGCDSTYGLKLTIYHSYSETIEVNGCDSAIWNDVLYTSSANLSSSLTTVHGCDSSTTVKIRIHPSVTTVDSLTTDVSPYEWNNEQYTESGVYTVVLSSIYGCDSTVTLVLTIDSTYEGIENTDNQSLIIEVWPNPTTDVINFSREVEECQVYDATGRLMMSEQNKTKKLNISHLPHGVYLLRIVTSDTTLQLRIILTK